MSCKMTSITALTILHFFMVNDTKIPCFTKYKKVSMIKYVYVNVFRHSSTSTDCKLNTTQICDVMVYILFFRIGIIPLKLALNTRNILNSRQKLYFGSRGNLLIYIK